jgi:hypothetical protein
MNGCGQCAKATDSNGFRRFSANESLNSCG